MHYFILFVKDSLTSKIDLYQGISDIIYQVKMLKDLLLSTE